MTVPKSVPAAPVMSQFVQEYCSNLSLFFLGSEGAILKSVLAGPGISQLCCVLFYCVSY